MNINTLLFSIIIFWLLPVVFLLYFSRLSTPLAQHRHTTKRHSDWGTWEKTFSQQKTAGLNAKSPRQSSSLVLVSPGLKVRPAAWIKHVKSIAIHTDWDWEARTIKYHLFHLRCSFGLHIDGCYFISHEWLSIFLWALRSLSLSSSTSPWLRPRLTRSLFLHYVIDSLSLFYHSFHWGKYFLCTLLDFFTVSPPSLPLSEHLLYSPVTSLSFSQRGVLGHKPQVDSHFASPPTFPPFPLPSIVDALGIGRAIKLRLFYWPMKTQARGGAVHLG